MGSARNGTPYGCIDASDTIVISEDVSSSDGKVGRGNDKERNIVVGSTPNGLFDMGQLMVPVT